MHGRLVAPLERGLARGPRHARKRRRPNRFGLDHAPPHGRRFSRRLSEDLGNLLLGPLIALKRPRWRYLRYLCRRPPPRVTLLLVKRYLDGKNTQHQQHERPDDNNPPRHLRS